jgi:hypothetical protein
MKSQPATSKLSDLGVTKMVLAGFDLSVFDKLRRSLLIVPKLTPSSVAIATQLWGCRLQLQNSPTSAGAGSKVAHCNFLPKLADLDLLS